MQTLKQIILLNCVIFFALACEKENKSISHYLNFQLNNSEIGTKKLNIEQETPYHISVYNLSDEEDSVNVEFGFSGTFTNTFEEEIQQSLSIGIELKMPDNEFIKDSVYYQVKNPEDFEKHIPTANLFENDKIDIHLLFHENTMSFCTGMLDENYDNRFIISQHHVYTDNNGNDAMDIQGTFKLKFESFCEYGETEITNGAFNIKVLLKEVAE